MDLKFFIGLSFVLLITCVSAAEEPCLYERCSCQMYNMMLSIYCTDTSSPILQRNMSYKFDGVIESFTIANRDLQNITEGAFAGLSIRRIEFARIRSLEFYSTIFNGIKSIEQMVVVEAININLDSRAFDPIRELIGEFSIVNILNGAEKLLNEANTFTNLASLTLRDVNIGKLDENFSKNSTKLVKLDISYCKFTGIPK